MVAYGRTASVSRSVSNDRNSNIEDYTWGVLRKSLVHVLHVRPGVRNTHVCETKTKNSDALPYGGHVTNVSWSLTLIKIKSLSVCST